MCCNVAEAEVASFAHAHSRIFPAEKEAEYVILRLITAEEIIVQSEILKEAISAAYLHIEL